MSFKLFKSVSTQYLIDSCSFLAGIMIENCIMNYENLKKKLEGCYVTVPPPFKDINNLPLNFDALNDYVEFLLGNGLDQENSQHLDLL